MVPYLLIISPPPTPEPTKKKSYSQEACLYVSVQDNTGTRGAGRRSIPHSEDAGPPRDTKRYAHVPPRCSTLVLRQMTLPHGEFPMYTPYLLSHSCLVSLSFPGCLRMYMIYLCIPRSFHCLIFFTISVSTMNSILRLGISYTYDLGHFLVGYKNNFLANDFQYRRARIDF